MFSKFNHVAWFLCLFLISGYSCEIVRAEGVNERNIGVVINEVDPLSVKIGNYYILKRAIPDSNVIRVKMDFDRDTLSVGEFERIMRDISRQTDKNIQAYALTWSRPFKVECMSITAAVSLGFDRRYCAEGCQPTKENNYFNSMSRQPFNDFGIRPSMLLAAEAFEIAKQLIDRGLEADYSRPAGNAYLLNTSDKERNVRSVDYQKVADSLGGLIDVNILDRDWVRSRDNVLFYFTGVKRVKYLESVKFLPGAVGDHLTSSGGVLSGSTQMNSMRWLEAGASGSYGTVVEPCNYLAKFPVPGVVMQHYLNGDSLVEAYWKSVSMPGQGVFIGDPLARPFVGCRVVISPRGKALKLINRNETFLIMRENTGCVLPQVNLM